MLNGNDIYKSTLSISLKKEYISNFIHEFQLKTLIGYSLETNKLNLYDYKKLKSCLLEVTPFIYGLISLEKDDIQQILEQNKGSYFIIKDQDTSKYDHLPKTLQKQSRQHFKGFSYNEDLLLSYIQSLDSDFQIKELDQDSFQLIKNSKNFKNHLTNFHNYNEYIIQKGFCFTALNKNKIVSVASSFCEYKNEVEIQVDTLKEYRGKNLATATSAALINNIHKSNKTPKWDAATNISKKLGSKLGFREIKSYIMLYYKHDA